MVLLIGRRRGDGRQLRASVEHPRDPQFQAALADLHPDACPVVAYGALLPQSALDLVPHGWINLHFSVLPSWRGAAPVQHALWSGDEVTGATTFRIVKELDAGPVFGVMTERVRPDDTAGDLLARLAEGGAGDGLATVFVRHTSASLAIQENASPEVLDDLVDALDRLAPRGAGWRHDLEGPDDMPAHVRAMLTGVSLAIPVIGGRLALGTWQGIFLVEHRDRPHDREIVVHFVGSKA